jgi:SAM-dependent methyltransferase
MHPKFLSILRCPGSGAELSLEVVKSNAIGCVMEGLLRAPDGKIYPIRRGVPRFVDGEYYSGSFGFEWSRWPRVQFDADNKKGPLAGHSTQMWEQITLATEADVRGKYIIEFGCGPGRFLDVVRQKGGIAVGIDMSVAVEAAATNFEADPDVLIVQGDITKPPFAPNVFDGGYTIGVLHHTPEPSAGLLQLVQLVKPGGWIACAVYRKGGFYDLPSVHRYRKAHLFLRRFLGNRPALLYSYLSAYALYPLHCLLYRLRLGPLAELIYRHLAVIVEHPDARWRTLDTFDAITPEIATCHTQEEIREWFAAALCEDVRESRWNATALVARKPGHEIPLEGVASSGTPITR